MLRKTKISKDCTTYVPDPEKVRDFFDSCGTSWEIEQGLWDMFQSSISNTTEIASAEVNAGRAYLYRRLMELIEAIEPPAGLKRGDLIQRNLKNGN